MKKVILFILIFILVQIINVPNVYADRGAKPSISIDIKNLNTDNYLIDLLVNKDDESKKKGGQLTLGIQMKKIMITLIIMEMVNSILVLIMI